jgi:hypothetical protein
VRRAVAATALLLAACDTTGAYWYLARSYDPARDCLGDTEALDVMSGSDPGLGCRPRCLTVNDPDAGLVFYGTTACGPPPFGANATESDPRCTDVLSALASTRLCTPDSGLRDSGSDAANDAASDAAADATAD